MSYHIDLSRHAAKALDRLDKSTRRRVMAVIDRLADDPRPRGCVKLSGRAGQWRVRAGDYRIIYEIHDAALLVLIIDVGHRRSIYR